MCVLDGDRDAGGRHHVDDLGGVDVVVGRHSAAMAGGDAAVEALAHRLEREIFQAARVRIVGVVHEHVDVEVVALAMSKQMSMCWRASSSVYSYQGKPPTTSQPSVIASPHQLGGAGIAQDALLRKGDHLDVGQRAVAARARQQARAARRPPIVPTSANRRKNVVPFITPASTPQGALRDFRRVVVALEVVGDLDRLRQRAGTFGRMTSPSSDLSAWRCRLNEPGPTRLPAASISCSASRRAASTAAMRALLDADIDELSGGRGAARSGRRNS